MSSVVGHVPGVLLQISLRLNLYYAENTQTHTERNAKIPVGNVIIVLPFSSSKRK